MTDHVQGFVVILDGSMREDDAEQVADALRMVKRVRAVEPIDPQGDRGALADHLVEQRTRLDIAQSLRKFAHEIITDP